VTPKYVYIGSPMTKQPIEGPRMAAREADALVAAGHYVYMPQLDRLWAYMTGEKPYETWLAMDFAWIRKCDAMVRCPGDSPGADREAAYMRSLGRPVYSSAAEFLAAEEAMRQCLHQRWAVNLDGETQCHDCGKVF